MKRERRQVSGGRHAGEQLYSRVRRFVLDREMIRPGETVIAGVSGGADSLCLFEVLRRLSRERGFALEAVHVHHGLRESAEADLRFVEELCREAEIPCTTVRVDAAALARQWGTGVEEAGRRIRYGTFAKRARLLEEQRQAPCRIAVAHHREDQAETVLFHLCRGTGLRGAGGMRPVQGRIIRPLLQESREAIEAFLSERGESWRTDETNADTAYTRNYLRQEILPRLTEGVNPAAAEQIARFAETCAEAERYLAERTREARARCALPPAALEASVCVPLSADLEAAACASPPSVPEAAVCGLWLPALQREDPVLQTRLLYSCLAEAAGTRRDLQAVHVEALRKLCAGPSDGQLSMPGKITAVRAGDSLLFMPAERAGAVREAMRPCPVPDGDGILSAAAETTGPAAREAIGFYPVSAGDYVCQVLPFDGDMSAITQNQYTKWFDYDKIGMFPVFRTRQPGDTMCLRVQAGQAGDGMQGAPTCGEDSLITKKLARIMLDGKIPAAVRDRIVLPFCGKEALWVPGLRMGDRWKVSSRTRRILAVSIRTHGGGLPRTGSARGDSRGALPAEAQTRTGAVQPQKCLHVRNSNDLSPE